MKTKSAPVLREIKDNWSIAGNVRLLDLVERPDGCYELVVERHLTRAVEADGWRGFFGATKDVHEVKHERWFSEHGGRWFHMPSGMDAKRVSETLNEHLHTLFIEEYASRRMFPKTEDEK